MKRTLLQIDLSIFGKLLKATGLGLGLGFDFTLEVRLAETSKTG